MKKSTKTLFTIISVISFVISFIFFLQAIFLMFNIAGYKDLYIEIIQKIGIATEPSEVNFEVYMGIFDGLVGILLNSYAAGVYLKISKAKNIILGSSRVVLYIGLLQCFFVVSIIPGVMAIIASVALRKQENEIVNRPREEIRQNSNDDLVDCITNLKARKDSGQITQEEYDRKLNEILEQSAKQDVLNGVVPEKKDTLQEKITNIKENSSNNNQSEGNKKDNE